MDNQACFDALLRAHALLYRWGCEALALEAAGAEHDSTIELFPATDVDPSQVGDVHPAPSVDSHEALGGCAVGFQVQQSCQPPGPDVIASKRLPQETPRSG